jgi:hypothetical protein
VIRELLGESSIVAEVSQPKSNKPPLDLLFSVTRSQGHPESVAVLIIGPYRNAALYSKRRHNELLRAMGMAWMFDHIVVVLPVAANLVEYKRWLAEYVRNPTARRATRRRFRQRGGPWIKAAPDESPPPMIN